MAKRIVILSDGTWNTAEQPNLTHVCRLQSAIPALAPDGAVQKVCYDEGVGSNPGLDKWTGGLFGHGLDTNVMDAYQSVCVNFEPGDQVYFFGFSRGAFTVRSCAGLIRKCGILRRPTRRLIREAYRVYRLDEKPPPGETWKAADSPTARSFRETNSYPVDGPGAPEFLVRFVGVWDTVGSLGIPGRLRTLTAWRYKFHDVELSSRVNAAFQALAIDERRKPFEPAIWQTKPVPNQEVEQAWFAGVHSDVGGGYGQAGLSGLAFMWMAERAARHGLALDKAYIQTNIRPDHAGTLHDSMTWYYRFLGDGSRTVEIEGPQKYVDESAQRRYWDGALGYKPVNLKAVLEP